MSKYKILTGTAKEVEDQLNELRKDYWIIFNGFSATNDLTTVLIELTNRDGL